MANARTGLWSAFGALIGGAAGAAAGRYAALARPRARGDSGRPIDRYGRYPAYEAGSGSEVEDAMVIGGATGAVLGSFVAATMAGEDPPAPPPTSLYQLRR
jgi:hypothetical protein